jgi:hypothetical protein
MKAIANAPNVKIKLNPGWTTTMSMTTKSALKTALTAKTHSHSAGDRGPLSFPPNVPCHSVRAKGTVKREPKIAQNQRSLPDVKIAAPSVTRASKRRMPKMEAITRERREGVAVLKIYAAPAEQLGNCNQIWSSKIPVNRQGCGAYRTRSGTFPACCTAPIPIWMS